MPIPEFVRALRSVVGTSPLWLSGVSAVVLDDDRRVLLTLRADNNTWAVVSGILEPGEEPAVDASILRLTSVDVTDPIAYPNGDVAQYLDITFLARYTGGTPHVADDENLDVAWFALDALPENLTATSRLRIEKAIAGDPSAWFRR